MSQSPPLSMDFQPLQGKWFQLASIPIALQSSSFNVMIECHVSKDGKSCSIRNICEEPGLIFGTNKITTFAEANLTEDIELENSIKLPFHARPASTLPQDYIPSVMESARQKMFSTLFGMMNIPLEESNYVVTGIGAEWFSLSNIKKTQAFIFVRTLDEKVTRRVIVLAVHSLKKFGVNTKWIEETEYTDDFHQETIIEHSKHIKKIAKKNAPSTCDCSCGCHLF